MKWLSGKEVNDTAVELKRWLNRLNCEGVKHTNEFYEELVNDADNPAPSGTLPWGKTHDKVRLRLGEVTVWAGYGGHGKSMMTGQVVLGLMQQGYSVNVASLEMPPLNTIKRMVAQWCGTQSYSKQGLKQFFGWSADKLWFYDHYGVLPAETVLALAYYTGKLGINHLFIDALNRCGIPIDDIEQQTVFMNNLCAIARGLNIGIHLIAHCRKPQGGEKHKPDKADVKGGSEICDMADNAYLVWHDKSKRNGVSDTSKPDVYLIIDKAKNGRFEGDIGLWFRPDSLQYVASPDAGNIEYGT